MAEGTSGVAVRALVAQARAVLLTRGLGIEPVAVRGVVAHLITVVAARVGVDVDEAVHLVTPEAVADAIVAAADPGAEGAASVHAVRPVRVDVREVRVQVASLRRLVMAVSQAGKYAGLNGDGRCAAHAMDLATEIGSALAVGAGAAEGTGVPVGVLDEAARLVEAVAMRIGSGGWSVCSCGREHGQGELDEDVASGMRKDAALARGPRARVEE